LSDKKDVQDVLSREEAILTPEEIDILIPNEIHEIFNKLIDEFMDAVKKDDIK